MQDLRILFDTAAGTGYQAQLADAGGRRLGVAVPFTPFLTEDDYEDLRWYLEDYMDLPDGGAVTRAQRIEGLLRQWGRRLYDALFTTEDNRAFLTELLDGPEPRRLTIATRDPALLRLPWELATPWAPPATVNAEGEPFTTLQLHMSYFLPVVEGRLEAHARVVNPWVRHPAPRVRVRGRRRQARGTGVAVVPNSAGGVSKM